MDEIDELEDFFKDKEGRLEVSSYATIEDLKLFSSSNILTARHNEGKPLFDVYKERLRKVKQILTKK